MSIRVHELAKELKISVAALKKYLSDIGININSHMSPVSNEDAIKIREKFSIDKTLTKTKSLKNLTSYKFEGIASRVCGNILPYTGKDKRLLEKGYFVTQGIKVLRGFAPIKDLAACSEIDPTYQRPTNNDHVQSITRFYENNPPGAKFIPEIILSAYFSNYNLTQINIDSSSSTSETLKGIIENLNYYNFELLAGRKLRRIDGNHRLLAADEIKDDMLVPFSILLIETEKKEDEETDLDKENEAFIFYFLNGKAKKLLPNEMYKGLVTSEHWTDTELAVADPILPYLKEAYNFIIGKCPNIQSSEDFLHSLSNIFLKIGNKELENINLEVILITVDSIICDIERYTYFFENFNHLLLEFVFYLSIKVKNLDIDMEFKKIDSWLKTFHYTQDSFSCPIKMYNCILTALDKRTSIFMAMPFPDEDGRNVMEEYNDVKDKVVLKLTNKGYSIDFPDIMSHKAGSKDLSKNLHEKIENCHIFIADVTGDNYNVLYELGLAKALKKPYLLIRQRGADIKKPEAFDIYTEYKESYNPKALSSTLGKKLETHIVNILKDHYGILH